MVSYKRGTPVGVYSPGSPLQAATAKKSSPEASTDPAFAFCLWGCVCACVLDFAFCVWVLGFELWGLGLGLCFFGCGFLVLEFGLSIFGSWVVVFGVSGCASLSGEEQPRLWGESRDLTRSCKKRELNENPSGNELYYTNYLIAKNMLCSQLHCQKGFNLILFSYKLTQPFTIYPQPLGRGFSGGEAGCGLREGGADLTWAMLGGREQGGGGSFMKCVSIQKISGDEVDYTA